MSLLKERDFNSPTFTPSTTTIYNSDKTQGYSHRNYHPVTAQDRSWCLLQLYGAVKKQSNLLIPDQEKIFLVPAKCVNDTDFYVFFLFMIRVQRISRELFDGRVSKAFLIWHWCMIVSLLWKKCCMKCGIWNQVSHLNFSGSCTVRQLLKLSSKCEDHIFTCIIIVAFNTWISRGASRCQNCMIG